MESPSTIIKKLPLKTGILSIYEACCSRYIKLRIFHAPGLDWQLQGMALAFDPEAGRKIRVTIQFENKGSREAIYQLHMEDGTCTFHRGQFFAPDLIVKTSPKVWWDISTGKLSGQQAFMERQYTVQGDLDILLQMNRLFRSREELDLQSRPGQRPPGPLPLPGMAWMQLALLPWIVHWIVFELNPAPGSSLIVPLLLSLAIISYRLKYGGATWLEWSGVAFFGLAGGLAILPWSSSWTIWGSVVSGLALSTCWLSSLLAAREPLSAAYSKWAYTPSLWNTDLFNYPNGVISLMWGWKFLAASLAGTAAIWYEGYAGVLSLGRLGLLLPAIALTVAWQKKAPDWPVADYHRAFVRLRLAASLGIAGCVALFAVLVAFGLQT